MTSRPTADSEFAVGCLMGLHHAEDTTMAKRLEKLPRRRSRLAWPQSGIRDCFDLAFEHLNRARGFRNIGDRKWADANLESAAHAHEKARQLLREMRA